MKGKARGLGILILLVTSCLISESVFAQCPPFPQIPPNINNPTQLAQTAWQIFVAMACPTNTPTQYPYMQWETWIEQNQEYPATNTLSAFKSAKRSPGNRFHASPLRLALKGKGGKAMATAAETCPNPSVTLVEEVRIEPTAASYIRSPAPGDTLAFRPQQAAFATGPPPPFFPPSWANINFPWSAIEIKVDWVQYTTSCPPSLQGNVWTETYGGNCYALAGMHVISKLLPNWIWATFEPQNTTTNPNRCVVLGCYDPFGSSPAQTPPNSPGSTTQITSSLQSMMTSANLNSVWQNYRLDGVQVNFTEGGNPTLLGNSVIECENAGVPLTRASCITCHFGSSINAAGTDGINNLPPAAQSPIGNPQPLPSGYAPRDFVWSLMLACPGGAGNPNCSSGAAAVKKKK